MHYACLLYFSLSCLFGCTYPIQDVVKLDIQTLLINKWNYKLTMTNLMILTTDFRFSICSSFVGNSKVGPGKTT
jgi:hypothetical protein